MNGLLQNLSESVIEQCSAAGGKHAAHWLTVSRWLANWMAKIWGGSLQAKQLRILDTTFMAATVSFGTFRYMHQVHFCENWKLESRARAKASFLVRQEQRASTKLLDHFLMANPSFPILCTLECSCLHNRLSNLLVPKSISTCLQPPISN